MDYSSFKDFAGPVATIIATIIAASVAGYFAWKQWRTAEKQSQIAEGKVLLDLFDRRRAVYDELRAIVGRYGSGDLNQIDCVKFREASSRAAFLFDTDVTSFLDRTHQDLCQEFVQWAAPRPISEDKREAVEAVLVARANRLSSCDRDFDERVSRYMTHHQKGP